MARQWCFLLRPFMENSKRVAVGRSPLGHGPGDAPVRLSDREGECPDRTRTPSATRSRPRADPLIDDPFWLSMPHSEANGVSRTGRKGNDCTEAHSRLAGCSRRSGPQATRGSDGRSPGLPAVHVLSVVECSACDPGGDQGLVGGRDTPVPTGQEGHQDARAGVARNDTLS
jgi:hypothetical protein